MTAQFLRVNAVTRADRHETIPLLRDAVSASGGWITDFHLFSNTSICLNFEIPLRHAARLRDSLKRLDLRLTAESVDELQSFSLRAESGGDEEITGTLQVTFVHNEPDLRIEVPPTPARAFSVVHETRAKIFLSHFCFTLETNARAWHNKRLG